MDNQRIFSENSVSNENSVKPSILKSSSKSKDDNNLIRVQTDNNKPKNKYLRAQNATFNQLLSETESKEEDIKISTDELTTETTVSEETITEPFKSPCVSTHKKTVSTPFMVNDSSSSPNAKPQFRHTAKRRKSVFANPKAWQTLFEKGEKLYNGKCVNINKQEALKCFQNAAHFL